MKTRSQIALLAFVALFALSGCGNKGPLVRAPVESPDVGQDDAAAGDTDDDGVPAADDGTGH